jgi:hypothetical protein
MPVAFNTDRAQAAASCRRLAGLDADIACFGHGEPVSRDAAAHLQAAARQLICRRRRGSSSAGGGAAVGDHKQRDRSRPSSRTRTT